jgi:hypothetical protein
VLIAITAAGQEVLWQAIPVHASTIGSALVDRFSETEQAALADLLRRWWLADSGPASSRRLAA